VIKIGQKEVLEVVEEKKEVTFDDVEERVDCHERQIYGALEKLEEHGEIEKVKEPNFPLQPKAKWRLKR